VTARDLQRLDRGQMRCEVVTVEVPCKGWLSQARIKRDDGSTEEECKEMGAQKQRPKGQFRVRDRCSAGNVNP
jgi:hypothetical protein